MIVLVWLTVASTATVDVIGSRLGTPRAALWVLVVWTVRCRRHRPAAGSSCRHAYTRVSRSCPRPSPDP
ncbi:hypothetical protein ACYAFX_23345 [Rhodococcus aetherivorans]